MSDQTDQTTSDQTDQTTSEQTDQEVIDEIRARYEIDHRLPYPAEVAITMRADGTVTLRGTVGSFQQRKAAVDIARSVDGVAAVDDELRVDLRDRYVDAQIRGSALQALLESDEVPKDGIDVSVSGGWLTLKGEVKHQSESDAAFDAVSGVEGVGGITNKIEVITSGGH
jgi:osmotically-inducible protein OsmY